MTTSISQKKRKQKGIALLIVIFALLLVTGIALAMMSTADTESQINRNYRDSQKAYFAALAGVQEARVRLLTDFANVAPSAAPANANNKSAIYILNPNATDGSISPWSTGTYFDDELCHEYLPGLTAIFNSNDTGATLNLPCTKSAGSTGWYSTVNSNDPNRATSAALDFKWVRITQKENRSAGLNYPVVSGANVGTTYGCTTSDCNSTSTSWVPICWTGTQQVPLKSPMTSCTDSSTGNYWESVYRVVSLAQTSSSAFGAGSRRMVIAEVAKTPPLVTNAAVDSQDHVTLNGQLNVNGFDSCTCNLKYSKNNGYDTTACTTTANKDGTTTTTCPAQPWATACDNSKYAIYASGSVDKATSSENLVAGTNPAVVQNQPWIYDINEYINTYKQGATPVTGTPYNYTCTAPTYDSNGNLTSNGTCGTQSAQTFGVPPNFPLNYNSDGTLNTSGQTPAPYSQVTYVPGNLQLTSSSQGNGILIVDGDLDIHGGLNFYGLILVRGVVKFTGGGSDHTNIIGAVLAGQESYVDNTLGGSAVIDFNSCALKQNKIPQPPRLVSIREATY